MATPTHTDTLRFNPSTLLWSQGFHILAFLIAVLTPFISQPAEARYEIYMKRGYCRADLIEKKATDSSGSITVVAKNFNDHRSRTYRNVLRVNEIPDPTGYKPPIIPIGLGVTHGNFSQNEFSNWHPPAPRLDETRSNNSQDGAADFAVAAFLILLFLGSITISLVLSPVFWLAAIFFSINSRDCRC
ncbi:MAG: hypothetical protein KC964_28820 [Candidatus Omnitrophica bacterium]|nr:hypothetical protein [Candidatus Omnitrophota bacterium]